MLVALVTGVLMMIWDCIEVGRNDATNIINSVFGSRILSRKKAVLVAGTAVVLGAAFSTSVMETARKGIFDPEMLNLTQVVSVYLAVYMIDTVLLYSLSSFGIPVSTTATLIFALVGAAIGVFGGTDIVHWTKVSDVTIAIIMSIIFSGIAGFLIQRMFRGAIGHDMEDQNKVSLHGPWIGGLILTWLSWFMVMKGMKNVAFVMWVKSAFFVPVGTIGALFLLWAIYTFILHIAVAIFGKNFTDHLFKFTALLGMLCMAFAFGQNDLANCASPGLSMIWAYLGNTKEVAIPVYLLIGCASLMVIGMLTKRAHRVTRAEVNTGSQYDKVSLYAPSWAIKLASFFVKENPSTEEFSPPSLLNEKGKKLHYDALRASVITSVGASVIAFASGGGWPVSTTYVAFAAVVATGWGDCIFSHGDSALKLGRSIWVVFCWFASSLVALTLAAGAGFAIIHLGIFGIALCLAVNLVIRFTCKSISDVHETVYHGDTVQENV